MFLRFYRFRISNRFETRSLSASFSTRRIVAFSILLLLFISPVVPAQMTIQASPPHGEVPKVYFGLHIHHLWQDTAWPSVPFGTWRLWDSHTMWIYLEPRPGVYDFALLDKYVAVAQEHGVEIVLTMAGTPTWASARPTEVPVHQGGVRSAPGLAAEPNSLQLWADFVRTVATRYKGRIRYYEIWNEPMSQPFFSGTPQTMVDLVRTAAGVLKQVDPDDKVLSPPVTGDEKGLSWFDSFLKAGGGQYIDIYGFHYYVSSAPEQMLPKISRARALLRSYGQDTKPMWNTEAGWQVEHLDPHVAADYVARALLIGWPFGLSRYILYSWDHPQMGIAPSGNASTPMVRAYTTVEQWLSGSVVTRCEGSPNGLWVENITMASGAQAKVVWSAGAPMQLTRDHVGNATAYRTLDGQTMPIVPGSVLQVSGSPILLCVDCKAN